MEVGLILNFGPTAESFDQRLSFVDHVLGITSELGSVDFDGCLIGVATHLQPASEECDCDQHTNNNDGSHDFYFCSLECTKGTGHLFIILS